ncbi:hypothetical protein EDD29_6649 [Actinocorallia herbida]|uniref:RDD family protein n=1 Tax=Actinocorallia herbida TaxID=58109 RepID=A0A3N1D5Y7_9ACTN|nr:hypothetical protein [Actinocorallia herbida]ROO88962.1 hypothetical protein EDD29_6649 [Actinocorallia herbida]
MNRLFPGQDSAWQPGRLRALRTAARTVAYLAVVPLAVASFALDLALAARITRTDKGANTYRLLARKT